MCASVGKERERLEREKKIKGFGGREIKEKEGLCFFFFLNQVLGTAAQKLGATALDSLLNYYYFLIYCIKRMASMHRYLTIVGPPTSS